MKTTVLKLLSLVTFLFLFSCNGVEEIIGAPLKRYFLHARWPREGITRVQLKEVVNGVRMQKHPYQPAPR